MTTERFPKEFQCRPAIPRFRHEAFQNVALVIDGSPEVVRLSVDPHEYFVEMPSPLPSGAHPLDASAPHLGGKQRAEAAPPEPYRLVADVDAPLVEKVFDIAQRQRRPVVQHHRRADDLGRRFEVTEGRAFHHGRTISGTQTWLEWRFP